MYVIRVLTNGFLIAAEIAAAAGLAWLALHYPMLFAGLTAGAAFVVGVNQEYWRLQYEYKFYFGDGAKPTFAFACFVSFFEALFKGLLAGLAAVFTFAGTDQGRLFYIAIAFGITIYLGAAILRWLAIGTGASPSRWGFFRLGPPLGLVFSALVAAMAAYQLIPAASVGQIGWSIVWDMPKVPKIEQVSELLFQIKQAFDGFVVTLLATQLPETTARVVAVVLSVNVLAGFVAAFYASLIAGIVRWVEEKVGG